MTSSTKAKTKTLAIVAPLVFAWLLVHRFRVGWLEYQAQRLDLDQAVAARRSEAGASVGGPAGASPGVPAGVSTGAEVAP